MNLAAETRNAPTALRIRQTLASRGDLLLGLTNVGLAIYALLKLTDEFRRLLFETGRSGAIDLLNYQHFVNDWFSGIEVYRQSYWALYPPASYPILWLLVGWLDSVSARWFSAALFASTLAVLAYFLVRATGAKRRLEQTFVALMLLAMNATGVTVGNGQLGLYVLALVLGGLFLLQREHSWRNDLIGSLMITASLVKPSISFAFIWLALFVPGRLRAVWLVAVEYVALTLFAVSFQHETLVNLVTAWLRRSAEAATQYGYANLSIWLSDLGFKELILPSALLAWLILGGWIFLNRNADFWVLLGVGALTARLSVYHMLYDDVLIIFPMIALFRIAKRGNLPAGILLGVNVLAMLFLASWQKLPAPWHLILVGGHAMVWLADLIFLVGYTIQTRKAFEDQLGFFPRYATEAHAG
jgi:glycosyl transferase family 87